MGALRIETLVGGLETLRPILCLERWFMCWERGDGASLVDFQGSVKVRGSGASLFKQTLQLALSGVNIEGMSTWGIKGFQKVRAQSLE